MCESPWMWSVTPRIYRSALITQVRVFVCSPAAARTELDLIRRENLLQISTLQAEMERSQAAPRPRRQQPPPPPPPPPPPSLPLQPKTHIDAPLSLVHNLQLQSKTFIWLSNRTWQTRAFLNPILSTVFVSEVDSVTPPLCVPQLQARSFSSPMGGCVLDSLDSLGPAPYDPASVWFHTPWCIIYMSKIKLEFSFTLSSHHALISIFKSSQIAHHHI